MCNSAVHRQFNMITEPFPFSTFQFLRTCNRLILPTGGYPLFHFFQILDLIKIFVKFAQEQLHCCQGSSHPYIDSRSPLLIKPTKRFLDFSTNPSTKVFAYSRIIQPFNTLMSLETSKHCTERVGSQNLFQ